MKWRIAAVIPNWNGARRLERCLASLENQTHRFDQIIVVDNGSTDGSERLAQIRIPENRGFAVAVNRGITAAAGVDWIAILNNDVVLDPGWLEAIVDIPADFQLVAGRTLQAANHRLLDGAGDALSLGFAAARLGHGAPDGPSYAEPREVFGVCFATALVYADVFRTVGVLEERFFAYLEDAEFNLRARLAGFRAWYAPAAVAYHEGSASSSEALSANIAEWMTAHQLLLAARYAGRETWPRVAMVQMLWAARMLLRGRSAAWLRGVSTAKAQWADMRDAFPVDHAAAAAILRGSEELIRRDPCANDLFWKFYFSNASA
jgi:GT2 family glycosyltransferase